MEKLSKERIEEICDQIFSESDIIAMHGTSIAKANSIMETGFNFVRTSMVIQESKKSVSLSTYGWKENPPGDAANVIISIPKSFIIKLLNYNDEEYIVWLKNAENKGYKGIILDSVCDMSFSGPLGFSSKLPREFIRGMFVYMDNTNYLSFLKNPEEGMNHLTFIDNPHYYEFLSEEEQIEFVNKKHEDMFGSDTIELSR